MAGKTTADFRLTWTGPIDPATKDWEKAAKEPLTGSGTLAVRDLVITGSPAVGLIMQAMGEGNDLRLKLDYATKEPGAYPILLVTYEIVCSKSEDPKQVALTKAFLKHFSSQKTQSSLEEIGYAPLPDEVRTKVDAAIDALS